MKKLIDERMKNDDKTRAKELGQALTSEGHAVSKSIILRCRWRLGWTYRGSAYCQLIRETNKEKRLWWATQYCEEAMGDGFQDVLWTDECTVQLEAHRRFCSRRKGEPPRNKPW